MLTIGEHILLVLAEVWDLLDEIPSRRQTMAALANPGNTIPYKKSGLATSLYRMRQSGEIERVEKDGEVYYRLTTRGRKRATRDFSIARFGGQKWDGKWRVVIFDIPEEQKLVREAVRRRLLELGFGMLQKSVWLSPFKLEEDMASFLEAKGLAQDVLVMVVDELWVDDERELALRVWELDRLDSSYDSLIGEWEEAEREFKKGEDREKLRLAAFEWERRFLSLLKTDPCLPPELLPDGWSGNEARQIYKKKVRQLLHKFQNTCDRV